VCNQTKDIKNKEKFKGHSNGIIDIMQRDNILDQSLSTTLFAMAFFSNISQITTYERS